jgi:hypothetical protein
MSAASACFFPTGFFELPVGSVIPAFMVTSITVPGWEEIPSYISFLREYAHFMDLINATERRELAANH